MRRADLQGIFVLTQTVVNGVWCVDILEVRKQSLWISARFLKEKVTCWVKDGLLVSSDRRLVDHVLEELNYYTKQCLNFKLLS